MITLTRRSVVILIIGVLVAMSGIVVTQLIWNEAADVSETSGTLIVHEGNMPAGSPVTIDGQLDLYVQGTHDTRFRNVSVRFYHANGTLFSSECLGTLSPSRRPIHFSMSTQTAPKYIIFASPDIWRTPTHPHFSAEYYVREDGMYLLDGWTVLSQLPINIRKDSPCRDGGGWLPFGA